MVKVWLGVVALVVIATAGAAAADEQPIEPALPDVPDRPIPHSWVPEDRELQVGAIPLEHVQAAATHAAGRAECAVTDGSATAMLLAMTWPEVSPSGEPPSPMTLSRWDNQPSLGDPLSRAPGLWFHPGIGMWQLDSAGLGADLTAAEAMDTEHVSQLLAPYVLARYCASRNGGASAADARAYAWRAWHACNDGACEDVYGRARAGIAAVVDIGQFGGAVPRTCWHSGAAHDCVFVDPGLAEGSAWWNRQSTGRSPVAAPFYVLKMDGDPPTEVRYWLAPDAGADADVAASRVLGRNARDGLSWTTGAGLCDLTEWRGDC